MTTTPPEPPMGGMPPQDPNAGYGAPPPGYGAPGMPGPGTGQWAGPPLAEWPARAGGFLIDAAIMYVPYLILLKINVGLALLALLGLWLYLMYMQGTTGQTWGKQVLKIKLVREQDGQVIGFPLAIGRHIVHIVDSLACFVGWLFPLWDAKKQTFADKILQTVVIKV